MGSQWKKFSVFFVLFAVLAACGKEGASNNNIGPLTQAQTALANGNGRLMLALKFVEFMGSSGSPVLDANQINSVVQGINQLWSVCDVQFKVESEQTVAPANSGLPYGLSSMSQLDPVRSAFDNPGELVVTDTGPWNHSSMGSANAWTAMPGQSPSGAVIESTVAVDPPITAHELGHYLGLNHVSDPGDLMNPIIYPTSTRIDPNQCQTVRQTAVSARAAALRSS